MGKDLRLLYALVLCKDLEESVLNFKGVIKKITVSIRMLTIGHSTKTIAEFVRLLQVGEVERVIDIRKVPRSRTNPQFNRDVLGKKLKPFGIKYTYLEKLGGLQGKSKDISPDVNGYWLNQSFHNYADYALTDAFREGLQELLEFEKHERCAIMCSEAVWWSCHRRIVADYLIAQGKDVFHLMNEDQIEPAFLTEGAVILSRWKVVYPGE